MKTSALHDRISRAGGPQSSVRPSRAGRGPSRPPLVRRQGVRELAADLSGPVDCRSRSRSSCGPTGSPRAWRERSPRRSGARHSISLEKRGAEQATNGAGNCGPRDRSGLDRLLDLFRRSRGSGPEASRRGSRSRRRRPATRFQSSKGTGSAGAANRSFNDRRDVGSGARRVSARPAGRHDEDGDRYDGPLRHSAPQQGGGLPRAPAPMARRSYPGGLRGRAPEGFPRNRIASPPPLSAAKLFLVVGGERSLRVPAASRRRSPRSSTTRARTSARAGVRDVIFDPAAAASRGPRGRRPDSDENRRLPEPGTRMLRRTVFDARIRGSSPRAYPRVRTRHGSPVTGGARPQARRQGSAGLDRARVRRRRRGRVSTRALLLCRAHVVPMPRRHRTPGRRRQWP